VEGLGVTAVTIFFLSKTNGPAFVLFCPAFQDRKNRLTKDDSYCTDAPGKSVR
jgi:hypothetical protein